MIGRIKNPIFLSLFFCFIIISCIFLTSCGQAPQGRFQLRGLSHGWGGEGGGGLTPARDLTGTWEAVLDNYWYQLSYVDGGRTVKYTGRPRMTLTQNGSTVTGTFFLLRSTTTSSNIRDIVTFPVAGVPATININNGVVSSTSFYFETFNEGRWEFTFTSDLIEGHIHNCEAGIVGAVGYDSDTKAFKLIRSENSAD